MNRKLRACLLLVFAAVFVFSGVQLLQQRRAYLAAHNSNASALELASQEPLAQLPAQETPLTPLPEIVPAPRVLPEPKPAPQPDLQTEKLQSDEPTQFLLDMDLEALRAVNPDVLGWIYIPDTEISYPLLKAKDNEEYLYQTWDGKYSKYGSIFLECRNSQDLDDFNTLIYGHNMLTQDMFGTLLNYQSQSHWEAHPSVYIRTDQGVRRYDIFSAYEAKVVSDTYRLIFEDDARRESALALYIDSALYDTDLTPTVADHVLTLSTCTGRNTPDLRFVVQAILTEETEPAGP